MKYEKPILLGMGTLMGAIGVYSLSAVIKGNTTDMRVSKIDSFLFLSSSVACFYIALKNKK